MTIPPLETLLAETIRRRLARRIVIKDEAAFEALADQLKAALTRAWDDEMRAAIIAALDRLRDLGPGAFGAADAASILTVLEERVGATALQSAMRGPVLGMTDALWRTGAGEVGASLGIDIAFLRPDLDALDALKNNNLFWIGQHWNNYTKDKLDKVLTEYFTTGLTREGLAARMAEDFRTVTTKSHVYWEMMADHIATKAREIGRVTGYQRAGIRRVQIRAHIDERTTPCCRQLHGRIFTVEHLAAQRDAYFDAARRGDVDTARRAWVMHGKGADLSTTPTRDLEGVGNPPYHFRCRTITVAYWEDGDELPPAIPAPDQDDEGARLKRWKRAAYDRERLPKKEIEAIIERAKTAHWPHLKVVRGHYRKHQRKLGIESQSDFSQSAIDLIRRGNRDVYTSIRDGVLNVTFVRPAKHAIDGRLGFMVTSVDLEANKITSHHWRAKLQTSGDEVPAFKQPGRGIMKWLIGL